MICPSCNKKMTDLSYKKMTVGPWSVVIDKFLCQECSVKYEDEKWAVPIEIRATEKQIRAVKFISKVLDKAIPELAFVFKRDAGIFIGQWLDKAIKRSQYIQSEYEYLFPFEDLY